MGRFLTNSITLILISLLLCGCGDRTEIRRTLYAFMDTEVSLPGEAIVINNGEVSKTRIKKDSYPLLVSFYGYNDCYECEIAHLSSKLSHFLLSDSLKSFRPIIIFAPEAEELSHTIHDLELAQYPFPVYVTLDNGWTNNCNIPTDSRFHTFLMDNAGHPIFVGDPTRSPAMMKLFKKRLTSKLNKKL